MTAYVLDASVAAKWFLPSSGEPFSSEARLILIEHTAARCRLLVPDLFWPEVGNIFWKAVRQGRVQQPISEKAILALEQSGLTTVACLPLLKDAMSIARAFNRSVYDAIYVSLAIAAKAPFITADERLANALAARFPIRWLGTFPAYF